MVQTGCTLLRWQFRRGNMNISTCPPVIFPGPVPSLALTCSYNYQDCRADRSTTATIAFYYLHFPRKYVGGQLIKTSPLINSVLVSSLLVDLTGTKLEIPVEGEL